MAKSFLKTLGKTIPDSFAPPSQLRRTKGVAGLQRAAVKPPGEPGLALFRGAMGEGMRLRHPPGLPLQVIVTDHPRRVQRLLQVAALHQPHAERAPALAQAERAVAVALRAEIEQEPDAEAARALPRDLAEAQL